MKQTSRLSLNLFTKVQDDLEKRQYVILAELKKISGEFQYYKVYPHLSFLVDLHRTLKEVIGHITDLRNRFPKRISKIDWVNQTIEHDVVFVDGTDLKSVEELILWAIPHIEKTIQEGAAIHEYVSEGLTVEHVGIVPSYRDEGYFFLPDNKQKKLNLFRFEVSIFQSAEDKYRSLKTKLLKSLNKELAEISPNSVKLDLIKEQQELPNPATFSFYTDLDFSFDNTILPIAKRKLMQKIYS
ncbi:hypothetical protein [Rhodohalobacter sp. 8-1]|uniref:hypothetical protein n=1 Tax=Rhodohalobacter sp. 8-1 TaxID=3131972 RepID=UPI0030ED83A8